MEGLQKLFDENKADWPCRVRTLVAKVHLCPQQLQADAGYPDAQLEIL